MQNDKFGNELSMLTLSTLSKIEKMQKNYFVNSLMMQKDISNKLTTLTQVIQQSVSAQTKISILSVKSQSKLSIPSIELQNTQTTILERIANGIDRLVSYGSNSVSSLKKIQDNNSFASKGITKKESKNFNILNTTISLFKKTAQSFGNSISGIASKFRSKKVIKTFDEIQNVIEKIRNWNLAKIRQDIETLSILGKGIKSFGLSLSLSMPLYLIGSIAVPLISTSLLVLNKVFSKIDGKKLQESSKSVKQMSISISAFGLSLMAFQMMNINATTIMKVGITLTTLSLTFALIGTQSKNIIKGSRGIMMMSYSIGFLGASLLMFKMIGKPEVLGSVILSVALLGMSFALLGLFAKPIYEGSKAMVLMSIGLIGISIGLMFFSSAVSSMGGASGGAIVMTILTITGLSIVFGFAGLFSSYIIKGALAMTAAGISLIFLSIGITMMSQIKMSVAQAGLIVALIAGVSTAMVGVGLFAPAILLGAVALGVSGLSLIALSEGVKSFASQDKDKINEFLKVDTYEFMATPEGKATKMLKMTKLEAVVYSITSAMRHVSFFRDFFGAIALAKIGDSLTSLANGVNSIMSSKIDGFLKEETFKTLDGKEHKAPSLSSRLIRFIESIARPFSELGKKSKSSVFSIYFGADFGMPDAYNGATSLIRISESLKALAEGVAPFVGDNNPIVKAISIDETLSDETIFGIGHGHKRGRLAGRLTDFISAIAVPFAAIGKTQSGDTSLTKILFGGDFTQTDVDKGVSGVKGIGEALKTLAEGIRPYIGIDNPIVQAILIDDEVTGYSTFLTPFKDKRPRLANRLSSFINAVSSPFAAIGKSGQGSESLMKSVLGYDFAQTDVDKGISGVVGIGTGLKAIADGITPFIGLNNPLVKAIEIDTDIKGTNAKGQPLGEQPKIANRLITFISAISKPFASIGKRDSSWIRSIFGIDFSKTDVEVGASSVAQIGDSMKKLALGAMEFNKLIQANVKLDVLEKNITSLIKIFPKVLKEVAVPDEYKGKEKVKLMNDSIDTIIKLAKESKELDNTAKQFERIAKSYRDIALAIGTFRKEINQIQSEPLKGTERLFKASSELVDKSGQNKFVTATDAVTRGVEQGVEKRETKKQFEEIFKSKKDKDGKIIEPKEKTIFDDPRMREITGLILKSLDDLDSKIVSGLIASLKSTTLKTREEKS